MSCCSNNLLCKIIKNKNNQYFVYFFIGAICQFVTLLVLTIDFYVSRDEYIWFCSKILTIKKMVKDNYDNYKIYQLILSGDYYQPLKYSYYDLLKNSSKNECDENLKQCGILDTYGNKLCLYKDYPCPINEIITDLKEKKEEYNANGYIEVFYYHLLKKNSTYFFYIKNTSYDKQIIHTLFYAYPPNINLPYRFIGSHNFVFDIDAFEQKYEYKIENINNVTNATNNNETIKNVDDLNYTITIEGEEDENDTIWSNISQTKIKLMQSSGLKKYIDNELNKADNNNDKNYTQIFYNIYIKNFVGFENAEQMDIFKNADFTIYKSIFPHNIKILLVIVSEVLLVIFVIIYIRKLVEDEEESDNSICKEFEIFIIICGLSIYSLIFLYFFIYFINSLVYKLNNNNKFSELTKIKADKYIEEFIKEFLSKYNKKGLICCSITLFSLSLICYIISIFLYMKVIKIKTKVNVSQNDYSKEKNIPYTNININNIEKIQINNNSSQLTSSQRSNRELNNSRNKKNRIPNIKIEDNCLKRILKCDIFKKH